MNKSIRKFENLHIAFWLVKDTCWVLDYRILGVIMIFPTIFLSIYITYKFRKQLSELFHNIAVCLWICANTTWMLGEFFYDDTFRPYSTMFFIAGLLTLVYFYLFVNRKLKTNSEESQG
jgi:hypothetical protein